MKHFVQDNWIFGVIGLGVIVALVSIVYLFAPNFPRLTR